MKTFQDFTATRQFCADLGARFNAEYFEKSPRPCMKCSSQRK